MARIRTIKPDFFRDEELQDLEAANPGCYTMLVYAGLWGHCDKNGTFEYRPRQLKLDILPFIPFNMDQALELLSGAGFICPFEADGKKYAHIPEFTKHQRINGKEAQEEAKYPEFVPGKQRGSNGEAVEITGREGKGREGNTSPGSIPVKSPRAKRSGIPENFCVSEANREWASKNGVADLLPAYLDYFRDYAKSNGKTYADWDAAFRNCVKGDWGGIRKNLKPKQRDQFEGAL